MNSAQKHIKNYSLMAAAFLAASKAEAQTVFTDLDPDLILSVEYFVGDEDGDSIDINGDGVMDFHLYISYDFVCGYCAGFSSAYIQPLHSNRVAYVNQTVVSSCYTSDDWVFKIVPGVYAGELIGDDEVFTDERVNFFVNPGGIGYCSFSFAGDGSAETQFIPVQLNIDGELHNAWIRFSLKHNYIPFHADSKDLTIHDYAYNASPDSLIITEALANTSIIWNYTDDIADNIDGTDLKFSFHRPASEENIVEYRVIAVKASAPDITIAEALLLPDGSYLSYLPDGSLNYENVFPPYATDIDGDLITNNVTYKLFVLVNTDPASGELPQLSAASPEITLETDMQAGTVLLLDEGDTGDATDIKVHFTPSPTENLISEYRVMISGDYLSLDGAGLVTAEKYISVTPDGTVHNVELPPGFPTLTGEPITYGIPYTAHILYVNNGLASGNILAGSWEVTLDGTTNVPTNIQLTDIDDNGNGSDMRVSFDKAEMEATVDEYRVILMPTAGVPYFTIHDAEMTIPFLYYEIYPTGDDISFVLPYYTRDIHDELIIEGVPYSAYVLTIASSLGDIDKLSAVSNSLTLGDGLSVNETEQNEIITTYQHNTLYVALPSPHSSAFITLTDIEGRKILETTANRTENVFVLDLAPGIYLVSIQNGAQIYSRKIMVL